MTFAIMRVVVRGNLAARADGRIDAHARPERRDEARHRSRRGQEAARGILRVDADLDRVPASRRPTRRRERLAGRDADLLAHDVDPGDELRDRVLDLEPAVDLDEVEGAVRADEELERAGVPVADRLAGALDRRLHRLARLRVERGRRRLLDELLVAALDRALALAEREDTPRAVAEHLDLDVAGGRHELLDVDVTVAERRLRLGARRAERVLEVVGRARRGACPSLRRRRRP